LPVQSTTTVNPTTVTPEASRITLAWQFIMAGLVVLLIGMVIIGLWVTSSIERGFVQNRADSTALFVDSIISPLAQDLSQTARLNPQDEQSLLRAIKDGPLANRIFSFKIWTRNATVAFSSDPALLGKTFELRPPLRMALDGHVSAEFDRLEGEEHLVEKESGFAFLEVYSPIRDAKTGDVIGSAEFYEPTSAFRSELRSLLISSWLVVASVTVGMLALLFVIVARGSARIERQRKRLDEQVGELSQLLASNTLLRERVDQAAQRTITLNERYLRRISADLHDGPAQLLGFVVMRLEAIRKGKGREDDNALVMKSVVDAIDEIRSICRGLQLPELEGLSGKDVALRAVMAHEHHSGTRVIANIADVIVENHGAKICIYRFLQEALSNATRHAGAKHITASLKSTVNGWVEVCVEDDGLGFVSQSETEGLGLAGLRERAASLGGHLDVISESDKGTQIRMLLP
jgi:signal transduction histidine kinase